MKPLNDQKRTTSTAMKRLYLLLNIAVVIAVIFTVLSSTVMLADPVTGLFTGAIIVAGYLWLRLLIALLFDVAGQRKARLIWLGFALFLLVIGVLIMPVQHMGWANNPLEMAYIALLIIGTPMSMLGTIVLSALDLTPLIDQPQLLFLVHWLLFIALSYLQWFIVLPKLLGWMKSRSSKL